MSTLRRSFEQRLGPALVIAARLPRAVPFLVVAALLVVGLLVGGPVGAVLVLFVAALLALLLVASWPALQPSARLLRLTVVLVIAFRGISLVF